MTSTKIIIGAPVVFTLLLCTACQRTVEPPQQEPALSTVAADIAPAADHDHPTMVEWQTVETFDELVAVSDLVVRGTVVARRFEQQRLFGYSEAKGRTLTAEEAGEEYTDVPLTISTVRIDRLARATELTRTLVEGDQIQLSELGGPVQDGCLSAPDDKPLLAEGQEVVLFLSFDPRLGVFHQVGGWQGRMYVDGDVVRPLAVEHHPGRTEFAGFDGRKVEDVLALSAGFALRAAEPTSSWPTIE